MKKNQRKYSRKVDCSQNSKKLFYRSSQILLHYWEWVLATECYNDIKSYSILNNQSSGFTIFSFASVFTAVPHKPTSESKTFQWKTHFRISSSFLQLTAHKPWGWGMVVASNHGPANASRLGCSTQMTDHLVKPILHYWLTPHMYKPSSPGGAGLPEARHNVTLGIAGHLGGSLWISDSHRYQNSLGHLRRGTEGKQVLWQLLYGAPLSAPGRG